MDAKFLSESSINFYWNACQNLKSQFYVVYKISSPSCVRFYLTVEQTTRNDTRRYILCVLKLFFQWKYKLVFSRKPVHVFLIKSLYFTETLEASNSFSVNQIKWATYKLYRSTHSTNKTRSCFTCKFNLLLCEVNRSKIFQISFIFDFSLSWLRLLILSILK